ncbi:MerC domain-containing protein [Flavivirga jejuensis]|uniref:MerC domain-containing protein n=1 Tax=Flavivirga jejuensis TaxID=870487 RepID=A0ABT8WM37_9FLAO|nr:MerC domain-containing protein [Flavivirga jejuensis]MDO5974064.1 MerC domain-containing protein [Flavivirga jejuensis]
MILTNQKPDNIGAIASTLCLIHCIVTPFIFIVQSCSITCCSATPTWWKFIDYFFLIISFFAIYRSTQTTSKKWIKPSLWLSWSLLFFIIINEKTAWYPLHEYFIYFPALALIILHLYNKKYCQCNLNKCCANER